MSSNTRFGTPTGAWIAERLWDQNAEAEFSSWIEQLGSERAKGTFRKLADGIASRQANRLYTDEDRSFRVFADCADVPVVLRAYFAYKTRRPFQFVSRTSGSRYTAGNKPTAYKDFRDYGDLKSMLKAISTAVHSGFYRTAPEVEDTDTYPIDVTPRSIRPGVLFYDPNGHVLLVYKVEPNGLVRLMDGHPDNSLTHTIFGEKFARGGSKQGGGFRAWRPYRASGSTTTFEFVRQKNKALPEFSAAAQYQRSYTVGDHTVGYHDWVRSRLSGQGSRVKPVEEFGEMLSALCTDIQDRVEAVNSAVGAGIHCQAHPGSLPTNIYGSEGEWETWSTPSRDARLKASFHGLHEFVKETVTARRNGDSRIDFDGDARALAAAYLDAWNRQATEFRVTYKASNGVERSLDLNEVLRRLFALSFDPYHSIELRWGVTPPGEGRPAHPEYAASADTADKVAWYWKEQRLRNAIERLYGQPTPLDSGPSEAPDVDVPALMRSLAQV